MCPATQSPTVSLPRLRKILCREPSFSCGAAVPDWESAAANSGIKEDHEGAGKVPCCDNSVETGTFCCGCCVLLRGVRIKVDG